MKSKSKNHKTKDLIYIFKSFHGKHYAEKTLEILGFPEHNVIEKLQYSDIYISDIFKKEYNSKKKWSGLKGKQALYLFEEYPENSDEIILDEALFFPIRLCTIKSVEDTGKGIILSVKLGKFVKITNDIKAYTLNLIKNIGEKNLPVCYNCGKDKTGTFKLLTLGEHIPKERILLDTNQIISHWEKLANQLLEKTQAKDFLLYYIKHIYLESNKSVDLFKKKMCKRKTKLKIKRKYEIVFHTIKSNDLDSDYTISVNSNKEKNLLVSNISKTNKYIFEIGTLEKGKHELGILFNPEKENFNSINTSIPFHIGPKFSIPLLILFLIIGFSFSISDKILQLILGPDTIIKYPCNSIIEILGVIGIITTTVLIVLTKKFENF